MKNMYEAGVGLAHHANDLRDRILENERVKSDAQEREQNLLGKRSRTLGALGLIASPSDFNDCDSTELYMSEASIQADTVKFEVLADKASLLLNTALDIEAKSTHLSA